MIIITDNNPAGFMEFEYDLSFCTTGSGVLILHCKNSHGHDGIIKIDLKDSIVILKTLVESLVLE